MKCITLSAWDSKKEKTRRAVVVTESGSMNLLVALLSFHHHFPGSLFLCFSSLSLHERNTHVFYTNNNNNHEKLGKKFCLVRIIQQNRYKYVHKILASMYLISFFSLCLGTTADIIMHELLLVLSIS